MPLWLLPALDAWTDLRGEPRWRDVREWCAHYGIEFEWLMPVMRRASDMLGEHIERKRKPKRAIAPRNRSNPRS